MRRPYFTILSAISLALCAAAATIWLRGSTWIGGEIVLALAVLPFSWMFVGVRAHWRASASRCVACGYELRTTHDRCPECGTATWKLRRIRL